MKEQTFFDFQDNYSVDAVDPVEKLVDSKGNILDASDIMVSPFDVIKNMGKSLGITVNYPKAGCNYCYGQGYIGRDSATKSPIPCQCIFDKSVKKNNEDIYQKTHKMSRAEKRQWERNLKKQK